jgi:Ni/Co efflux regulator RcnB
MVSPNPPYVAGPTGGMVSPNPPYASGPTMQAMPATTGGPYIAGPQPTAMPPAMASPNPPYYNTNQQQTGGRWGGSINGRWWGGSQAPGGWGGYRRPRRGGSLDPYWMQSNFQIPDYLSFGLAAPPYGYFWVRYYDDAVLVDARGSVHNSVSGIAWSDASAYAGNGYAASSASASASAGGYGGRHGGPIGYVDPNPAYYDQPQGGYAPPVAYGPPAGQSGYYQQGCHSACPQVYQGGGYQQGGYYQGGGYYSGGATTTTVVIQSPPVVTTTIIEEEIVTEEVVSTSYVRSAPRRVVRRAPHRPKPRPVRRQCGCQCVCR